MKPDEISREDTDSAFDWQMLDSQVSAVLEETRAALEEAQAATRKLGQKVERLYTLSGFMRQVEHTLSAFTGQVESGLAEVRHQLKEPPQARRPVLIPSTVPSTVEVGEPWPLEPEDAEPEVVEEPPLTALEAEEAESRAAPFEAAAVAEAEETPLTALEAEEAESRAEPLEAAAVADAEEPPAPAEREPSERAPSVAEVGDSIRLQIESSEANIDLMVVERALRETPGVADVDLLDYAGKRARVQVTFGGRERPNEAGNPERLAANVQERLAKLTWDGSLAVSATE